MTPDQFLLDETHAWLTRARRDVQAAKVLTAAGAYAEALFHCQQAAEKPMKAFLTFHQTPFQKTHELGKLGPECVAIDASLRPVLHKIDMLTKYAWRFRYPGAPYEPDAAAAADGLQKAEAAFGEIERRLPPRSP